MLYAVQLDLKGMAFLSGTYVFYVILHWHYYIGMYCICDTVSLIALCKSCNGKRVL